MHHLSVRYSGTLTSLESFSIVCNVHVDVMTFRGLNTSFNRGSISIMCKLPPDTDHIAKAGGDVKYSCVSGGFKLDKKVVVRVGRTLYTHF